MLLRSKMRQNRRETGIHFSETTTRSTSRSVWEKDSSCLPSQRNINYIGIERYSSVLLRALEKLDSEEYEGLTNIRFICMDAADISEVFEKGEVEKIYLNFSDPWPKARHARRRLTSKEFFARYDRVLAADGTVEFKTDNRPLFDFSLEQVTEAGWTLNAHTFDLHHDPVMNEGNVMTEYEQKFSSMGNPIHKLIASRSSFQCI